MNPTPQQPRRGKPAHKRKGNRGLPVPVMRRNGDLRRVMVATSVTPSTKAEMLRRASAAGLTLARYLDLLFDEAAAAPSHSTVQ